jgi:L-rhamnonate dehydratase
MKITDIQSIPLEIPYHERVREHLQKGWSFANRATDEEFNADQASFQRQWRDSSPPSVRTTFYRVHTDEGLTGIAEGMAIEADQISQYIGCSPFQYIMDDRVGPLQIAFYDLMGQALNLPLSRLFGPGRDNAPLAFWSHCFPPQVLQAEAQIALAKGYTVHKFKRRAHTDVLEQVASIAAVAPPDYEITVDANCTFGTTDRAVDIGKGFKQYPQVKCLESPVDQSDVAGYEVLQRELGYPLAIHFGDPDPVIALHAGVYDYFILSGDAACITREAHIAAAGDKPFWMQTAPDTGVVAAFTVHLAAAIPNATLSHISMHSLLERDLLKEPLVVEAGYVNVSERIGLGVEVDMDVVERYRVG